MKLDTICVQGTYKPKNGEPRVIPIIQSTTYKYDSSVEMGNLFDLKESGYFYSRLQNPTCDNVAAKIAALEGGVARNAAPARVRRQISMPCSILRRQATILFRHLLFTAAHTIFLMSRCASLVLISHLFHRMPQKRKFRPQFKPNTKCNFRRNNFKSEP